MRRLLALLALLALLTNPVTAAAAQVACAAGGNASAMNQMDKAGMPGMAHADAATTGADPCCDHHSGKSKTPALTCVQACATACAVIVAGPSPAIAAARYATAALVRPTTLASRDSQAPARLERPPRSIS